MKWFVIDAATSRICGTREGGPRTVALEDTDKWLFRQMDEDQDALFRAQEKDAHMAGRSPEIFYEDGGPILRADDRIAFRVSVDRVVIGVDDALSIAFTCIDAVGNRRTDVEGDLQLDIAGRVFALSFAKGRAERTLRGRQSGRLHIVSTPQYRIEAPVEVLITE